jgi:hypothetical protein
MREKIMEEFEPLTYALLAALLFISVFVVLATIPRTREGVKTHSPITGNLSQIASSLVAIIGFTIVILQLHDSRQKAATESLRAELADARRLYSTYLVAALQYPKLTRPNYEDLVKDLYEYERYETFVSHMLYAYDDILNASAKTKDRDEALKEWKAALKADLGPHRQYLCQVYNDEYWTQFRPALKQYVLEVEGDCKQQKPLPHALP